MLKLVFEDAIVETKTIKVDIYNKKKVFKKRISTMRLLVDSGSINVTFKHPLELDDLYFMRLELINKLEEGSCFDFRLQDDDYWKTSEVIFINS